MCKREGENIRKRERDVFGVPVVELPNVRRFLSVIIAANSSDIRHKDLALNGRMQRISCRVLNFMRRETIFILVPFNRLLKNMQPFE